MMARIAATTRFSGSTDFDASHHPTHAEIIAQAAHEASRSAKAASIVVFTSTGATARQVARYRSPIPVVAFTPSEQVARQLTVVSGVFSVVAPNMASTDEMIALMDRMAVESGHLKPGDPVIFVAGQPIGRPGMTNMLIVHRIGAQRQ